MSKRENLIITGGSAASPNATDRAKRVNPDLEVTMFEQGRFALCGF